MNEPFDIVLFGGGGDLSLRKLIPALYRAFNENQMLPGSRIFATCRHADEVERYLDTAALALQQYLTPEEFSVDAWGKFKVLINPILLDIAKLDESWQALKNTLEETPDKTRIYYLAIPPAIFGACCQRLSEADLISPKSRLVVEKPLGYDFASAEAINTEIATYFDEQSIYRIDHYLGKETVENLLALRFTNLIFEQLWDSKSIDHVQISISETVGLEGRSSFYNDAGAMRDMVQNHLLQLLCLIAMESPNKMNARSIQAEKIKVLEALRPITGEEVNTNTVRGQYVAGSYNKELVSGYLEELKAHQSNTETFVAVRAYIDNWRWARVPFYLRTGKRMKARCAEIVIQFKDVAHKVYGEAAGRLTPNRLVIRLQPEELIQLSLMSKNLDNIEMQLQPATLNLNFSDTYNRFRSDAYKRLILNAATEDTSLFISREEVQSAWAWVDPIIQTWQSNSTAPNLYRAGSWGPEESDELMAADGRRWFNAGEADEVTR